MDKATDCQDTDCEGKACSSIMVVCPQGSSGSGGPDKKCSGGFCNKVNYVCKETDCGDGKDNEGDGKTDCADDDCNGQACAFVPCPAGSMGGGIFKSCSNQLCSQVTSNLCTEINCNDNIDNDLDGKTDGSDSDCPSPDLIPVGATKTGPQNGNYTYKLDVKNQGNVNARAFWTALRNGIDNTMISACFIQAGLQPGITISCSVNVVDNLSKAKIVADNWNNQPEANKNNNIATFDV